MKLGGNKWLSKNISNLIRTGNKPNNQGFISNTVTYKMKVDLHMFRTCMEDWIDQHVGGSNSGQSRVLEEVHESKGVQLWYWQWLYILAQWMILKQSVV